MPNIMWFQVCIVHYPNLVCSLHSVTTLNLVIYIIVRSNCFENQCKRAVSEFEPDYIKIRTD